MAIGMDHDRTARSAEEPSRRRVLRAALSVTAMGIFTPTLAAQRASQPFTVGLLGTREPPSLATKTLRRVLERAVARAVAFETFTDGERLVEAAATGRVALSVHTALTYAAARVACDCLVPLVRPITPDGQAGLRAVVLARRGGTLRRTDDLAGATVLGGSDGSIPARVARIGLRHRLRGLAAPLFIGTGARVDVRRFAAGAGDALIGHQIVDRFGGAIAGHGTAAKLDNKGDYTVLWRSGPIWHGPVALHRSHAALAGRVREALLSAPSAGAETIGLGLGRVSLDPARSEEYDLLPLLLRADG